MLPWLDLAGQATEATHDTLKIIMKSAWGSDDSTKAPFPFHGHALAEAGHDVQIFLPGEAVCSVYRYSYNWAADHQMGEIASVGTLAIVPE